MEKISSDPESLAFILKNKKATVKPPAYPWQELALQIINELGIPNFKRSAVFKVCKENYKEFVLIAFNDTKELCHGDEGWKYFFKIIEERRKK
jgi:hypothetical protein